MIALIRHYWFAALLAIFTVGYIVALGAYIELGLG